jgi:two-component system response regulator LytT
MNILIVEDEDLAVKKLLKTITQVDPDITVAGITDSISDTVAWLQTQPMPDLILMDIELADGQSFAIFDLIKVTSPVIFTTSYDEYALKAFKVNSIDYLLKPIQPEDLEAALKKLKTLRSGDATSALQSLVKDLHQQLAPKEYRKRFLVKNGQKLVSVETKNIAYFYSDGRLNFFKTQDNKKYIVDYTMEELEDMLQPAEYFRISRSFIISIASVKKIEDYFGNRLVLQLLPAPDKEVLVSREKVSPFKKWLGK